MRELKSIKPILELSALLKLCQMMGEYESLKSVFLNLILYYYHQDHLGTTNVVTDYEGDMYEHILTAPYGEIWVEESKDSNDYITYKFTGKELDDETGLYYFGARYYDNQTSRWMSADPIYDGIKEGFGIYTYCHNNPLIMTDPTGLSGEYVKDKKANNQMVSDTKEVHSKFVNPLIESQKNVLPHDYNGVEAIGRSLPNLLNGILVLFKVTAEKEIQKLRNAWCEEYNNSFINAMREAGSKNGYISGRDLLDVVLKTNSLYAGDDPVKISIFTEKPPRLDPQNIGMVMSTALSKGFIYPIDFSGYEKIVQNLNSISISRKEDDVVTFQSIENTIYEVEERAEMNR